MANPRVGEENEPGLRERQKIRRREQIIAAGKELLFGQGYAATSMEEIAALAEVGVATVYNYFGSKGRLLVDIFRPGFDEAFEHGGRILAEPPEDPVTAMLALIEVYRQFPSNWENKEALRAVMGPGMSAEPVLDAFARKAEEKVKQQIEELVLIFQKRQLIRPSIVVKDAAMIIFYIFNQHFIEYITRDDTDYGHMKKRMDRQITFIMTAIQS